MITYFGEDSWRTLNKHNYNMCLLDPSVNRRRFAYLSMYKSNVDTHTPITKYNNYSEIKKTTLSCIKEVKSIL